MFRSPIWACLCAVLPLFSPALAGADPPVRTAAQVEQDWLTQEAVRWSGPGFVTTQQDAAGACDGVRDGKWGFHTESNPSPWWQVDLGAATDIRRVVVYNRTDSPGVEARAAHIMVLVSDDGQDWREVYRHDGTPFLGTPDGKPLIVRLDACCARFVRLQLPEPGYFYLDEVEVYSTDEGGENLALHQLADQCSVSQWSVLHAGSESPADLLRGLRGAVARSRLIAGRLRAEGAAVPGAEATLDRVAREVASLPEDAAAETVRNLYLAARSAGRQLLLGDPLLDFDAVLFAKSVPSGFTHMSDQYYGWWSRPGGGIFVLEGLKSDAPRVRCLTEGMAQGSFLRPELSYDGTRVLFAYCAYYPEVAGLGNKLDKDAIPEDAFYHVYEVGIDGTGLRKLTSGRYDDFDARYLPDGRVVLLSTRRGTWVQTGLGSAQASLLGTLPDAFVRCGGDAYRPVSVYTLHVMGPDGEDLRAISPFESFEWTPSIAADGRVLYARWDYIDRSNMPYISLWSTNPDGTDTRIVFGNFTTNPHCIFEARPVPGSRKLVFTASGHHSITAGSLVLLDPSLGVDGDAPMLRLTPEVCFPEAEGWPRTYFANPYPLSEDLYLTSWSNLPLMSQGGPNPPNATGLYLYDRSGALELLYRDPDISSGCPVPVRPRERPPALPSAPRPDPSWARFALLNVYDGLTGVAPGTVHALRIVGIAPKTQPNMNTPNLGVTGDDPGKFVIGTVPVEADGSARFDAPPGVGLFFQALDETGMAVQTMRSAAYAQAGESLTCVGCHENRLKAPANSQVLATRREPSPLRPGPEGSWPLRYDRLVQPVLDARCAGCHSPGASDARAAALDLSGPGSYEALLNWGAPSLRELVAGHYAAGRSIPGKGEANQSALWALLAAGHGSVTLSAGERERLLTWMDLYAQRQGSFDAEQEQALQLLRTAWGGGLGEGRTE